LGLGAVTAYFVAGHRSDAIVLGLTGSASLAASFGWPGCQPAMPWLRRLGLVAFVAVVAQGVLGGLRVVLFKDQIGIFHATLAQLFFALTCALALFTSPWWEKRFGSPWRTTWPFSEVSSDPVTESTSIRLGWLCLAATVLILGQLVLGATMRHQHAGLAVPDFPLAYGKLWPAIDAQSVAHYNQRRIEVVDANPITGLQIVLQMLHRLGAIAILITVTFSAWAARREHGKNSVARHLTLSWLGLVLIQILLGAATIWSNKAADIATAHVLVGALSLGLGTCLCIILISETGLRLNSAGRYVHVNAKSGCSFGASGPSAALGLK
jgi:cytochrome c oxidase assembly protein subunit 15